MTNPNAAPTPTQTPPGLARLFALEGSVQAGTTKDVLTASATRYPRGTVIKIHSSYPFQQYNPSTHHTTTVADGTRPLKWELTAHLPADNATAPVNGLGRLARVVTYNGSEFSLMGWAELDRDATIAWGSVILPDGRVIDLARLRAVAHDVQLDGFTLKIVPEGFSSTEVPTLLTDVAAVDEKIRTAVTLLESSMPAPEV